MAGLPAALTLCALAAGLASAAQPAAAAPAAPAKVEASTAPASSEPKTIAEVYNGVGVRDPFVSILGSGGAAVSSGSAETPKPNIHTLALRGVLSGARSRFALIEDASSGARFILKDDGKLYDVNGKTVAGVGGSIKSGTAVVVTTPADGDVQMLKMEQPSSK